MLYTNNKFEAEWDRHGSYQWTYFCDEAKSRISYFLNKRLSGKNIDIGGGWYLHYDNSAVVDLSSVCLEHNPAKEKLQFDLDELAKNKYLPYRNNSFDSATFISSWQYLRFPDLVTKEMKRVLKPGAEMYIINGQGAGLSECIVNHSRSPDIENYFASKGFDTLVEEIYHNEFKSVCVKMPYTDVFGKKVSIIPKKGQRLAQEESFEKDYINSEYLSRKKLLEKLLVYPVTKYSQDLLEKYESFSREYYEKSGELPLIFLDRHIKAEFLMSIPDDYRSLGILVAMKEKEKSNDSNYDLLCEIEKKHNISFCQVYGYFGYDFIDDMVLDCKNNRLSRFESLIDFISSYPLNSMTKKYQKIIYSELKKNDKNLDEKILKANARRYSFLTYNFRNNPSINELIARKKRVEEEKIETVCQKRMNLKECLPYLKDYIS
jgi:SAM-dependent methyltransferase